MTPVAAMVFVMLLGGMSYSALARQQATVDFGTQFVDLMRQGGGRLVAAYWEEYQFTNPVDEKLEPNTLPCERLDDRVVCGEIHKV